jgi:hypothetical protein
MTIRKVLKLTLYAGIVLAFLVTLVMPPPVLADVVCRVSAALTISDVSATNISSHHATIRWRTDDKATSQVFYDTVSHNSIADYTYHTRENKALVKQHKVELTGLSPSTTYYYRVRSAVGSAEFVSGEYTFRTLKATGRRGWWGVFLRYKDELLQHWPW